MARTDLRFDVSALDRASQVFTRMGKAVEAFEKRLERLDKQRTTVEVEAKTEQAERQVGAFATQLQRTISRAVDALPEIELTTDSSDADRDIARIGNELRALGDQRIGIDIDAGEAHAQAARLQRELQALAGTDLTVEARANVGEALRQLATVGGEVDRLDGRTARVRVDVDRSLSDTIVRVAALGRALGTLTLPAAALTAAPTIASIGAAAITSTGALGLVPAAAAAATVGVAALTVGLQGVSDALDEDPEKAAEALAKLAPAARTAVTAVRGFAPAWRELQLDVQQRLFDGLGTRVTALGRTYLPILRGELGRVADGFNQAGQRVTDMLNRSERVGDVRVMLGSLAASWENILDTVEPLSGVLVDVGTVGAGILRDLTSGAGDATREFAAFVAEARRSGDLARWMREGVDQVRQFGRIARDAGITVYNVLQAADEAGAGFLDTVERIVAATREWTSSAQGQATIVAIFRSIREAADAASPGVRILVDAIAGVIQRLGDAGVLRTAGEAFSAIAAEVAPLIDLLGNAAPAVSGFLAVVRDLAPVLVPAAAAIAGFWAATKVVSGISTVTTAVGGFLTTIRGIGQVDDATGKVRTLASTLGAGGILGLALAAAGVALSIYAGAQADAAQAAAEHKARVDELKATLDQYSGAATAATKADVARELGAKKLTDGTTSYASALNAVGISLADYSAAAAGNEDALRGVNAQLSAQVQALIVNDPKVQAYRGRLDELGVSMELLAAVALGNTGAFEELDSKLDGTGTSTEFLRDSMRETIGPLGELGSNLGQMAGQVAEAGQQVRDAATANRDFAGTLESVRAGFAGLAAGEPQTELMRAGLADLALAARDASTAAGENAAAWGGVAAGGAEAAKSMQQSRDAFLAAAASAGLTEQQAAALADQLGLIPAAARVNFETNAAGVTAELNTLKAQFDAVPSQKSVTVQALTEEARARLDDMGFRVEQLRDGTFRVHADTEQAKANLQAIVADANAAVAVMTIDANPDPATGKTTATVAFVNGQTGVMTLDANGAPAELKIGNTKYKVDTTTGVMTIDGNPAPGEADLSGLKVAVDRTTGTLTILGRDGGVAALKANLSRPSSSTHTIHVRTVGRMAVNPRGGLQEYATGGPVVGPGTETSDSIDARLSHNEHVWTAREVRRAGGHGQVMRMRAMAASGQLPRFASGGPVLRSIDPRVRETGSRVREMLTAAGMNSAVRSALDARPTAAPVVDMNGLAGAVAAVAGQVRQLRGDVDQGGYFGALIGEIRGLRRDLSRAAAGGSYADTARDAGLFGAWP